MASTLKEVAEAVGCGQSNLVTLIKAGHIAGYKSEPRGNAYLGQWMINTPTEEVARIVREQTPRAGFKKSPSKSGAPLIARRQRFLDKPKDLYSTEDLCEITGKADNTISGWAKKQGLTPLRNGRAYYYTREVAEKIVENFKPEEPAPQAATEGTAGPSMLEAQVENLLRRVEDLTFAEGQHALSLSALHEKIDRMLTELGVKL